MATSKEDIRKIRQHLVLLKEHLWKAQGHFSQLEKLIFKC